jgi:16S rRNA (adenine1518-N6/adenine1519-N6)-dimethyltransferase
VEIGPGLGALTWPLLERLRDLHVIEIDRDAIHHLRSAAAGRGVLHIHEADVLTVDLQHVSAPPLRIVGNLPYNISTPLLFHLIEQRGLILDMHFMLQKEVVDRMAAAPGDDDYGRLTVMLAPWVEVEPLFDVGAGAFRPPPKVMSTVVRLRPHTLPPFPIPDYGAYAAVVAAAFSQRRKTLRNALKPLLAPEDIVAAGVDPGLRAEVISPARFAALSDRLAATRASQNRAHL